MKPFQFKIFSIQQSPLVFRVGTDGVLLGSASSVDLAKNILEVGTGTGLVSLMLAQRNRIADIHAIDINENAVELAIKNFENSPFADKLSASFADFKKFSTNKKYDLIISNPPYFAPNHSNKDILARQQAELSFQNLIEKAKTLLTKNGLFSVIIPAEADLLFQEICTRNQLYLQRRLRIYGIINSKPKRYLLEFGIRQQETKEEELIIEQSPRQYSADYLKLTEEFHLFSK